MRYAIALLVLVGVPSTAAAQVALPRNDLAFSMGWAGTDHARSEYGEWRGSLPLWVSFGRYWTDHLKTDIDLGWNTAVRSELYQDFPVGPLRTFAQTHYRARDLTVGVGQSVQSGRNDWIHQYLGAGIDVVRRDLVTTRPAQIGTAFNFSSAPGARPATIQIPALNERKTDVFVRPYFKAGAKMYVSERAFVGTEVKLGINPELTHAAWKIAVGVDF